MKSIKWRKLAILFKNNEIYDGLSAKGKLAYLIDIENGKENDQEAFHYVDTELPESSDDFVLSKTLIKLTGNDNEIQKVLNYIDKQDGAKAIPKVIQELGDCLNINLTDSDGRWLLACIMAYSDDYYDKVLKIIAS
ncbi:hypothetical protein [Weissella sagaensis]|uniref:hypothetical protein n=1 Tax=Weissella sagaensis TaxID=2559928 RepID=UPI00123857D5|nr:hypothetical protein [Weissella sagaensis]KAA8433565.1 hypothetical protein FKV79_04655 [Weissella paramesenteroides]KAA8438616.1 hypothetical protein FKV73_02815 [Weissella paramesenteroides]